MSHLCMDCKADISSRHHLAERCFPCSKKREIQYKRIDRDSRQCVIDGRSADPAYRLIQSRCTQQVSAAIKAGTLKPARGQKCVDCGKPAQVHDHRDYRKPLEVEPVCRSCNAVRGAGLWKD